MNAEEFKKDLLWATANDGTKIDEFIKASGKAEFTNEDKLEFRRSISKCPIGKKDGTIEAITKGEHGFGTCRTTKKWLDKKMGWEL